MGNLILLGGVCAYNLVTERHWSSLRWLDPFEEAVAATHELGQGVDRPSASRDTGASAEDVPLVRADGAVVIMSHPAARYYDACLRARRAGSGWRIDRGLWRRFAIPPEESRDAMPGAAQTDRSFAAAYAERPWPRRIVTLEAAGSANVGEWKWLREGLDRDYEVTRERHYLRDPDAALKDRLDPRYVHPPWRIVVRWWDQGPAGP